VGARYSAPVQIGPGAQAPSYTMGTGSFAGLKWPERDVDHPLPSSAEVKEGVQLYLYFPSKPSRFLLWLNLPSSFYLTSTNSILNL
jgi:hypothetical protein